MQPATIEQVRRGRNGRLVTVPADVNGVVEALHRHDPCLRVRYAEAGDHWVVYRVHRNDQPCADDDLERTEELVLTAQQLDQRIVRRVEQIDSRGRGGYDYAREIERQNQAAAARSRRRARDLVETHGEELAHAIRADLGTRYKGRPTPHRYGRPGYSRKS